MTVPTDRLRKDVACFHTFMLMNIINMINCRVINENQNNVFKTLFKRGTFWFWAIFIVELAFQNGMIIAGEINSGPFKFLPNVLGVCNDINWKIHLTAWIFGLFPLAIRPLTNKIDVKYFKFMDSIDLETKHGVNCVTKWADKAKDDLDKAQKAGAGRASEYKKGEKPANDDQDKGIGPTDSVERQDTNYGLGTQGTQYPANNTVQ